MKINLDKLFKTTENSTPSIQHFLTEESMKSESLRRLELNAEMFQAANPTLNDISVIQRVSEGYGSTTSCKKLPLPGERLYYQSQANEMRKAKERELIRQQQAEEEGKINTFTPVINQKYRKNAGDKERKKLKFQEVKSTKQIKEQEQLKECTFKPIINLQKNQKRQLNSYQSLYLDHKLKEIKKKIIQDTQKEENKKKPMSKTQLKQFLQRQDQFSKRVSKKQQILQHAATKYDLTSGNKLFSPTIINKKSFNNTQKLSSANIFGKNKFISQKGTQYQPLKEQFQHQQEQFQKPSSLFKNLISQITPFDPHQQTKTLQNLCQRLHFERQNDQTSMFDINN